MEHRQLSCTKINPSVLLVEPDTLGYSERASQLDRADFCVTRAANLQEIYLMRAAFCFFVAILSDTVGSLVLRSSAEMVRVQWPSARILLLGKAPSRFDDHLYDEAVLHSSNESVLLAAIAKITEDPWKQRGDGSAAWLARPGIAPPLWSSRTLQESDPSKVAAAVRKPDYARNQPVTEHIRQVRR